MDKLETLKEEIERTFDIMERTSDKLQSSIGIIISVVIPILDLVCIGRNLNQREAVIIQDLFKRNPGLKESLTDINNQETKFNELDKENNTLIDKIKYYKNELKIISTLRSEEAQRLFNDCIMFQKEGCQVQNRIAGEVIQFIK